MARDVLMIVHTMGTLEPSDNDRFTYLAKRILEKYPDSTVEIVTSDFEHHKKRYRDKRIAASHPFTLTFLHEDSYKKNVSLSRIKGHTSFARRLKEYLKLRKKPDVIYCAVPPLVSANVAADYANKSNIKFIIDVQDLWPESFSMVLGNNLLSRLLLAPLMREADAVYSKADVIFAVSQTFAKRAQQSNHKGSEAYSIFLGTDSKDVDDAIRDGSIVKPEDEFWLGYVGNIGVSYDFENVIEALFRVKQTGRSNIFFHIIGDGNRREAVEKMAEEKYPNTFIHGYVPYNEMFALLKQCDIVINPIIKKSVSSVINKVGDYAAAGIATINTQDSEEYRELLAKYNAGINTIPEDPESISKAIIQYYDNKGLRLECGGNNRRMYEDLFDRRKTYDILIDEIVTRK